MLPYKHARMTLTDINQNPPLVTTTQSVDTHGYLKWTQWHRRSSAQVETSHGVVGPKILNIAEKITDSQQHNKILGRQEIYLLGGFIFFEQFAVDPQNQEYHNDHDGLYLILAQQEQIQAQEILKSDGKISLKVQAHFSIQRKQSTKNFQQFANSKVIKQYSVSTKNWTDWDYEAFLSQHPNLKICGDAIQISFEWKGEKYQNRWLFPHPQGVMAALEHLIATTKMDDWQSLQNYLTAAHPIEKERVFAAFLPKS